MNRPSTIRIQQDAARARKAAEQSNKRDVRVYVDLPHLVTLQHQARGFSFLPRQPVRSLLTGRHASRVRGRGLNFEDIRTYHPGDDIRTIDWKVTARLRSPHTRVYTEERDRPTLLVVDHRIGMFFGTQRNMKSVTAAEVAALALWRILDTGDRVGALLFDDNHRFAFPTTRRREGAMRILQKIVHLGEQMTSDSSVLSNAAMLGDTLEQVERIANHDHLVIVISDFHGMDESTEQTLKKIRVHNDVIAVLVHDPSASRLPESDRFVVSNGDLQAEFSGQGKAKRHLQEQTTGRIASVLSLQRKLRLPVLPISAGENTGIQLSRLMGQHMP